MYSSVQYSTVQYSFLMTGRALTVHTDMYSTVQYCTVQFPDDREGSDCILQDVYTSKILNYPCLYNPEPDKAACPICEVQRRNFILAGVCLSSAVDTVFVMESPTVFLGYIQTTLMYNVDSARWEIVNTTHTSQVRKIFKR